MANEIFNFNVIPSVVPADEESEIVIESRSGIFKFYDGVEYDVKFIPTEQSDVPTNEEITLCGWDKNRKTYCVKAENGRLKLKYKFFGEQKWRINITSTEERYDKYEAENGIMRTNSRWKFIHALERGITVSIYSLLPDLYRKNVKKGDFHIHTMISDGTESPERTAANYRKAGFDVIAMTEHNIYYSSKDVEKKLDFMKNYKIMCGEEVHNGYGGLIHMVNIGSRYSVNEIYINEPDRVKKEVEELKKSVKVPDGLDEREYLYRVWTYNEIKKSGGYAIYPHPFWTVKEHYNVETKMSRAILQNGLCDAFELMGGCTPDENNLQHALYEEMLRGGVNIPIVGSSDSHSSMPGVNWFNETFTILFADGDDVLGAIDSGYSVAVEAVKNEHTRIFGDFRMMKYAQFLLENYFARRDELCKASGLFVERYLEGDDCKDIIISCEDRIEKLEKEFFGRR